MKKLIFAAIVLMIVSMGSQNIFAQKNNSKMMYAKKGLKELNLTDVQKEKFKENRFAHEEARIDIEAKIKKNQLEIKKMMADNILDEDRLMNLIDKGSQLKAELMKSKTKMWLANRNILNNDQKKIWSNHFNHMGERGERFHKMGCRNFNGHRNNFNRENTHERFGKSYNKFN